MNIVLCGQGNALSEGTSHDEALPSSNVFLHRRDSSQSQQRSISSESSDTLLRTFSARLKSPTSTTRASMVTDVAEPPPELDAPPESPRSSAGSEVSTERLSDSLRRVLRSPSRKVATLPPERVPTRERSKRAPAAIPLLHRPMAQPAPPRDVTAPQSPQNPMQRRPAKQDAAAAPAVPIGWRVPSAGATVPEILPPGELLESPRNAPTQHPSEPLPTETAPLAEPAALEKPSERQRPPWLDTSGGATGTPCDGHPWRCRGDGTPGGATTAESPLEARGWAEAQAREQLHRKQRNQERRHKELLQQELLHQELLQQELLHQELLRQEQLHLAAAQAQAQAQAAEVEAQAPLETEAPSALSPSAATATCRIITTCREVVEEMRDRLCEAGMLPNGATASRPGSPYQLELLSEQEPSTPPSPEPIRVFAVDRATKSTVEAKAKARAAHKVQVSVSPTSWAPSPQPVRTPQRQDASSPQRAGSPTRVVFCRAQRAPSPPRGGGSPPRLVRPIGVSLSPPRCTWLRPQ